MVVYAATIFLGAFLLFQVQPLIAKFILPWFGGSAAVWSAALLFFQLLLLGGYLYAHCLIRYFRPKQQFVIHGILLAASLATLPIIPRAAWKPSGGSDPTLRILLLLGATIGLPYGLLSATSPLLQAWYVRTRAGAIPYRLFALSNLGSMFALVSYPVLFEPRFGLLLQARAWSAWYAVFAILCIFVAFRSAFRSRDAADLTRETAEDANRLPGCAMNLLWIGLAACASILLLAVTSHLTQNVAPIPLLWIAPLSLYLLSFILCFESDRIYRRYLFLPLLIGALFLFAKGDDWYRNNVGVSKLIPALCIALFTCCMVCHGELARSRPHPRFLTQFYLMVSIGGAAGGLFVALVAPRLFQSYAELPVAMILCAALVTCVLWRDARFRWIQVAMALATITLAAYLVRREINESRQYILSARNFYGVLRVRDDPAKNDSPPERVLIHGTIKHGTEVLIPGGERIATSYFGVESGINRAIHILDERGSVRIGILGLGAGVTATLARASDTLHYYEINPLVEKIAKRDFGFWNACPADKHVYLGDGRLVLEALPDEHLDLLGVDVFTSDAIPVHLLAKEAYSTYLRHLNPEGVLAIHITNRYLNLEPVVAEGAKDAGLDGIVIDDEGYEESYYTGSTWILLSRTPSFFNHPDLRGYGVTQIKRRPGFRAWTDDYSNILQILQ